MKSDLVDLTLVIHHETDKAVLVSETGERSSAVWLPKSRIEIERQDKVALITVPERLAIDKGLV